MFFDQIGHQLDTCPQYFIDEIATHQAEISKKLVSGKRKIFGDCNKMCAYMNCSAELQIVLGNIAFYTMSQQYKFLVNMVPYERTICSPGAPIDTVEQPSRYLNRVGETVVCVISGECIVSSDEHPQPITIKQGDIWRLNSRIPLTLTYTPDFVGYVMVFLDFDLKQHLMYFDLFNTFIRRKDEFIGYVPEGTTESQGGY